MNDKGDTRLQVTPTLTSAKVTQQLDLLKLLYFTYDIYPHD